MDIEHLTFVPVRDIGDVAGDVLSAGFTDDSNDEEKPRKMPHGMYPTRTFDVFRLAILPVAASTRVFVKCLHLTRSAQPSGNIANDEA